MKRWATYALVVFALNFAWEMAQGKWFASMQNQPFWQAALVCLRASFGDLVITAVAFIVAAVIVKNANWPSGAPVLLGAAIFVAVGLAITAGYEVFALSTGRWVYDRTMPLLFGIGALPLLQWLLLPVIEVLLFRRMEPHRPVDR